MCGIAGLFSPVSSFNNRDEAAQILPQMLRLLSHRGPDAHGIWLDDRDRCYLGHQRLSIIDTSDAGRQPMTSSDGRYVITFNGEIYNFQELRAELEAFGAVIHGRTDTAVLLESISTWGTNALAKFDGMYAFAVFNRDSGALLLARDAFGEKPLYYAQLPGGGIAFASELRALEGIPSIDRTVSIDALGEYLTFQYINAPRTIYTQIKKLPPGHWLWIDATGSLQLGRYFAFQPRSSHFDNRPIGELADELEEILIRGIKRRLISDVPLGAFLSGGIDSSTICALIRKKIHRPLKTFSVGFEGYFESEHVLANEIARCLETEHHQLMVNSDIRSFLDNAGQLLDEPNGDSSCAAVYRLAELTRNHVTVALSGDGGDEMFFGYRRYFESFVSKKDTWRPFKPRMTAGQRYFRRVLIGSDSMLKTLFGRPPQFSSSLLQSLEVDIDHSPEPLVCKLRRTDAENYLPGAVLAKIDRMSMQHSLEVRTPFLSIELARFCERLPPDALYRHPFGKTVLREVLKRYLPEHLVAGPKRGFGLPLAHWNRQELVTLAWERLASPGSKLGGFFGNLRMQRFLSRPQRDGNLFYFQLWEMIVLESWLEMRKLDLPTDWRRRRLWAFFSPTVKRMRR